MSFLLKGTGGVAGHVQVYAGEMRFIVECRRASHLPSHSLTAVVVACCYPSEELDSLR